MARKTLWAFFILLIGVALLFGGGLNRAYEKNTNQFQVTNETITQDTSNLVYVENADTAESFNETVTVYNSTNVLLTDGTDYEWYVNGSIQFLNTTSTTDGNTATISYTYMDQTESTEFGGTTGKLLGRVILLLLLLLAGRFVFNSLEVFD